MLFTGYQRLHLRLQTALAVVDFVDDVGRYFVTAVGKDAVTFCNTQRRGFACTQSHRQAGRDFRRLEAEALDVLLRVTDTDRHQDADGHHVFRSGQSLAQRDVTGIAAV